MQLVGRAVSPTNIPLLNGNNTFTGSTTFSGTVSGSGLLQVKTKIADQTVTDTTTLAPDSHLSVTLAAGVTYAFRIVYFATTVATSGVKVDCNGGTATATSFIRNVSIFGNTTLATLSAADGSALNTSTGYTTIGDTSVKIQIEGTITVNAGGTFIPQFAQNAETVAAELVIAKRGSYMTIAPVTA